MAARIELAHKVHVLKPNLATGAKAYYHGLDGTVR